MKEKRARQAAERRRREKATEKAKAEIKDRLMALEVWRKKEAKAPPETLPEKIQVHFCCAIETRTLMLFCNLMIRNGC